jgi:PAS domain S-box-containing protein
MDQTSVILIVDDEEAGRDTLEALLVNQGYDLVFAGSGAEALTQATICTPDLILLDVMMHDLDGFEVCQRLRLDAALAEVPIIMVTGLEDRDSRVRGLEAGADDFISKPFDWVETRARVRTITRLSRYRRLRTLELQAERDRTRSILEALGEAVVVTDPDGQIQYINPATTTLTGFTVAETVGQSWHLWQNEELSGGVYTQIEEVVRTGRAWGGEVIHKRKDGLLYDAVMTVAPLFSPYVPGQVISIVSVQRDITALKETERLKDQFISNVSHELNTPLSIITLLIDNLITLYKRLSDTKRQKMMGDIQTHVRALNELVDSILKISHLDSKRMPREFATFNLDQLIREEVEKQLPLARQKSLTLRVLGSPQQLMVRGNDGQLRQVVRNLVNNAIKYTPEAGHITCECQGFTSPPAPAEAKPAWPGCPDLPSGEWIAVRVVDTGIGLEQQDLAHVFERFYRVKPHGTIRGTGLGLSITRDLVELHAGQIAVASTPVDGSIFAFYLPRTHPA